MIEELKRNVDTEIAILREISTYTNRIAFASRNEVKLLLNTIVALKKSMKIVNDSLPRLLSKVSVAKRLESKSLIKKSNLEKVEFKRIDSEFNAVVETKDREKLLQELSISEKNIKKLKKREGVEEEKFEEFKAARGYLKFSNKFFLNSAINWINKGYFKKLSVSIKKANIDILFQTYVSMIFMSVFLSIFVGIFLTVLVIFFEFSFSFPFISFFDGDYLLRIVKLIWIPFATPVIVFFAVYLYPSTEKSSISKRINQELPFAVIHMSAISGSGIQPSEIFRIIGMNKEYPYLRKEIRKVLNQINLYGYDLVTALNNVSKSTPSTKLAELFSGLETTIHSGGGLSGFFEKRAETLLVSFRLEREKYSKSAETYMDIYISVVIAAPMILMLLLVIMSIANFNIGLSTGQITFLIISILVLLNVIFLSFLHISQPSY